MTQKAKDGGADELMKTNPRVSDDRPEDVEGHRQPTTTGGKDGFSGPKKPLYTGEDDDVEGHRQPLPK